MTAAEGVVTGGDVLRALHEPVVVERPAPHEEATRGRARRGSARSPAFSSILPAIQAVAPPYEGVYLVGGAVRDVLLGRAEPRPRPDGRGRRARVRARAGEGAGGAQPPAREVPDRGREGHGRRGTRGASGCRRRSHRVLRCAGRAARGRALDPAPRPRAARLHDQRDGDLAQGRGPRAPPTTSSAASATFRARPCGCCTTSASSRTRRACCARSATRRGSGFAWTATPCRSRAGRSRPVSSATSPRPGLRDELLDILAEEQMIAALERIAELGLDRAMHPRLDAGPETIALIERAGRLMSAAAVRRGRRASCVLPCLPLPADVGGRGLCLAGEAAAPAVRPGRDRRRRHRRAAARRPSFERQLAVAVGAPGAARRAADRGPAHGHPVSQRAGAGRGTSCAAISSRFATSGSRSPATT